MVEVKNNKIYSNGILIGFVIDRDNIFVDPNRPFKWESVQKWEMKWFFKFPQRVQNMEYLGALDFGDRVVFGQRYKPVFRDDEIAIIEDVVISSRELDIVTNPMFLDSLFFLYPKYVAIEVGEEKGILYPTFFRVHYPSHQYGRWIGYGELKDQDMICVLGGKEYILVDTGVEVVNLFKNISPREVKLSIARKTKLYM